jgi:N-acetylglucosamine-6-phosphate deacetylase
MTTDPDSIAVLAGRVVGPDEIPGVVGVLVRQGKIVRLLGARAELLPSTTTIDLGPDAILAPGLIDVHTHGGWGLRYTDGAEAARTVLRRRAESGCTGLLLTVGGPPSEMVGWLPDLAEVVGQRTGGAVALGFHIEGPWLNWDAWVSWGARDGSGRELFPPDPNDFFRVQESAQGHVKLVSCAPEFPEALPFIETLAGAGVIPAIGHTTASPELARSAPACATRRTPSTACSRCTTATRARPVWC